jgi:hypothetical protein
MPWCREPGHHTAQLGEAECNGQNDGAEEIDISLVSETVSEVNLYCLTSALLQQQDFLDKKPLIQKYLTRGIEQFSSLDKLWEKLQILAHISTKRPVGETLQK